LVKRSRLAVDPQTSASRFSRDKPRRERLHGPRSAFRRVSPPSKASLPNLAATTANRLQLLSWALLPYSTFGIEDPHAAGMPASHVTPSGFGYPLDVFLPSKPCRFCFTPAALMGFTLRSVPLSRGIRQFPAGMTHLPLGNHRGPKAYDNCHRFLGFAPRESPLQRHLCLAGPPPVAPLGFSLSGVAGHEPCSGFRPNSSHVLSRVNGAYEARTSEYQSARYLVRPRRETASRLRTSEQPS